jgi:oligoribonuclease NrnB/cAMP/cGMP phosphodiesterase (DHH superfamily)
MGKVIELSPLEKHILVTHIDLDGVGCAIIYTKCFPNTEVYFVNYDEVNELVMSLCAEDMTTPIMISDLSVNEDVAEVLDKRGHVDLVDHHPTAKWLAKKYPWALVDTDNSATALMYLVMGEKFTINDYDKLVTMVDNYDTWGHGTEPRGDSQELNRLLNVLGTERFYQRFLEVSTVELSPVEKAILSLDRENEQKYINGSIDLAKRSIMKDSVGNMYALIAGDRYVSSTCHAILMAIPHIEYVIMVNFREDRAQVRGRGKVDVGAMCKELGGGGHKKAAGFPLSQAAVKLFLACDGNCQRVKELESMLYDKKLKDSGVGPQ